MIDFAKVPCAIGSGGSVGIGINPDEPNIFYLPLGYLKEGEATNLNTEQKKQYFFDLYRLFKAYAKKNKLDEKKDLKNTNQAGTFAKKDGYSLKVKETGEETLLYTKVNFLDTIMDAFDPHAIQNIANRHTYSEDFQFEDALNHLDNAIFLHNGAFIVDEAIVSQKQLLIEPTELAQMFCFIYLDVKTQLNEQQNVDAQYHHLAERFKEKQLFPQASLFEQSCFEQVKDLIKERLDIIDHHTALKDDDYWKLRDAIYTFLYADPIKATDDTFWGIKNFWPIWEDLCLEAVSKTDLKEKVFMADTQRDDIFGKTAEVDSKTIYFKDDGEKYPFYIKQDSDIKYLYPDLVASICIYEFKDTSWLPGDYFTAKQEGSPKRFVTLIGNFIDYWDYEKWQNAQGAYVKAKSHDEIKKIVEKLNSSPLRTVIDFKYKKESTDLDKIKQYAYLNSSKDYFFSELWLPFLEEDGDCENMVPIGFSSFQENTCKEIKTRKINIHKLVESYIGVTK